MPRATCRCGQVLSVPVSGPDRMICPNCSARVRVRRDSGRAALGDGDGFIRFPCPCGRRLKVRAESASSPQQQSGKCPDCGRTVPVPPPVPQNSASSSGIDVRKASSHETPTDELDADDLAMLEAWTHRHLGEPAPSPSSEPEPEPVLLAEPDEPKLPPMPLPTPVAAIAATEPPAVKAEAGLRICTRCGRPLHLSAVACRNCGAPAPRR